MALANVKLAVENVSKTFRVPGGSHGESRLLPVFRRVSLRPDKQDSRNLHDPPLSSPYVPAFLAFQ